MINQSNVQRRIYLDGLLKKKTYSAVNRGSFLSNAGAEFPPRPAFLNSACFCFRNQESTACLVDASTTALEKADTLRICMTRVVNTINAFFFFFFLSNPPPSGPNKSRLNVHGTKAARSNSLLRDKPAVYTALIWDRHGCRDNRLLAASQSLRHFHRFRPG